MTLTFGIYCVSCGKRVWLQDDGDYGLSIAEVGLGFHITNDGDTTCGPIVVEPSTWFEIARFAPGMVLPLSRTRLTVTIPIRPGKVGS